MKKFVLFALASAALLGASSASAQEVTYVEDCSQGNLLNRNQDNWFITLEGGGNFLMSKDDKAAEIKNRIGATSSLYVGKWVTPIFGFRFGANWMLGRGATKDANSSWRKMNVPYLIDGRKGSKYYEEKFMGIGPEFDVMINLTNWWCGYRPGRVYNAVVHGGAGAYWTLHQDYKGTDLKWRNCHNTILFATVGWQNNFSVSKHVDLFLDLQYQLIDVNHADCNVAAQIGFTYKFNKTDWNCPVTAVCPTWKYTDAEGDALVARLANAENRVKDLQRQLDECLNRPKEKKTVVTDCEGLATVYYPIGVSTLSSREKTILSSVAAVMKENTDQKYILTGWADNYTGNDNINTRLRNERVNGVKNYLVACGVNPDQLDATIDNNNLTDLGEKAAPLDRAVTIREAK